MTDLKMDVWLDNERSKFIVGWTLEEVPSLEELREQAHRVLDTNLDHILKSYEEESIHE